MSVNHSGHKLREELPAHSRALGFDLIGATSHLIPKHFDAFERWLNAGMAGSMDYLHKQNRNHLRLVLEDARSAIVVGVGYTSENLPDAIRRDPSRGIIASYAGGEDYHPWMLSRLEKLAERIREFAPELHFRAYVDTGPVLERDFASQAGLGFIGKNACMIHPRRGSFFFLGVLITNLELPARTDPMEISCGNCTRCLEACPTGALVAPYVLDARRCISYWTIEQKGAIPHEFRPLIGNRVFGCDECQLACPWNQKFARPTTIPAFQTSLERRTPNLTALTSLSDKEFKARFEKSAILRAKRRGLLRNVAIALGNWGSGDALAPLKTLIEDSEPLIRSHAAWALGRIGGEGQQLLRRMRKKETDEEVRSEIDAALQ